MPHPIDIIRRIHDLPAERDEKLLSAMVEEHYRRGDVIERQQLLRSNVYYIKRGSARVFYIMNGKDHTYSFAFDDEFILLSKQMVMAPDSTMSIEFLEPTDVIFIPHGQIQDTFQRSNIDEAAIFMNAGLIEHTEYLEERVFMLQNTSARQRYEWVVNRYPRLLECATITQIASFLGLTKETLYRIRSGKY